MYAYNYVKKGCEPMTFLVASGKGGVGKSTVTCAVANSLATRGKRVLVVDGDAGLRCQDILLDVADRVVYDWGDVLCGNVSPEDALLTTPTGVHLLPAPALWSEEYTSEGFAATVNRLAPAYDVVFVDAPAGIGPGLTLLCRAAKCGLIVSGSDAAGIRGACSAADALRREGILSSRLIINGVKPALIRAGKLPNLDSVIDRTEVRLIGVMPYDEAVNQDAAGGKLSDRADKLFVHAAEAVARRLMGESVPLTKL